MTHRTRELELGTGSRIEGQLNSEPVSSSGNRPTLQDGRLGAATNAEQFDGPRELEPGPGSFNGIRLESPNTLALHLYASSSPGPAQGFANTISRPHDIKMADDLGTTAAPRNQGDTEYVPRTSIIARPLLTSTRNQGRLLELEALAQQNTKHIKSTMEAARPHYRQLKLTNELGLYLNTASTRAGAPETIDNSLELGKTTDDVQTPNKEHSTSSRCEYCNSVEAGHHLATCSGLEHLPAEHRHILEAAESTIDHECVSLPPSDAQDLATRDGKDTELELRLHEYVSPCLLPNECSLTLSTSSTDPILPRVGVAKHGLGVQNKQSESLHAGQSPEGHPSQLQQLAGLVERVLGIRNTSSQAWVFHDAKQVPDPSKASTDPRIATDRVTVLSDVLGPPPAPSNTPTSPTVTDEDSAPPTALTFDLALAQRVLNAARVYLTLPEDAMIALDRVNGSEEEDLHIPETERAVNFFAQEAQFLLNVARMVPQRPGTTQHVLDTAINTTSPTSPTYYVPSINEFVGYSWAERILLLSIAQNFDNTSQFKQPFELPIFIQEGLYCSKSFNSAVTGHRPSQFDERSQGSQQNLQKFRPKAPKSVVRDKNAYKYFLI